MEKLDKTKTGVTYRTGVREIAEALGIDLRPDQWVTIEDAGNIGRPVLPMTGRAEIVVWEAHNA